MDHEEADETEPTTNGASPRRILKVRLRQEHVIRLHELRILQGKSIASLLEGILEDYFRKSAEPSHTSHNGTNGNGARPAVRTEQPQA